MANVELKISYKNKTGDAFQQVIGYINPDTPDNELVTMVNQLNSLTTNSVQEILKIVVKWLSNTGETYVDIPTLRRIISGDYVELADDTPITEPELKDIIEGRYTPVSDDFDATKLIF